MRNGTDLRWQVAVAVAALLAAAVAFTGDAGATTAIGKREALVCTACHDKPGSKLLTDEGLYYEVVGSLDGFQEVQGAFGKCTSCHEKTPGKGQLTDLGQRLSGVGADMEGLQTWVLESHPDAIRRAIEGAGGEPAGPPPARDDGRR